MKVVTLIRTKTASGISAARDRSLPRTYVVGGFFSNNVVERQEIVGLEK